MSTETNALFFGEVRYFDGIKACSCRSNFRFSNCTLDSMQQSNCTLGDGIRTEAGRVLTRFIRLLLPIITTFNPSFSFPFLRQHFLLVLWIEHYVSSYSPHSVAVFTFHWQLSQDGMLRALPLLCTDSYGKKGVFIFLRHHSANIGERLYRSSNSSIFISVSE
jgi:hypothetical protein